MDNKVLYLHVGADKTGSTFIQSLLYRNSSLLDEHGFYYPEPRGREKDVSSLYNHHLIAAYFSDDPSSLDFYSVREDKFTHKEIKDEASQYMGYLEAGLVAGNFHSMVISYEGLNGLSRNELSSLKHYFIKYFDEIKVVYYLKPHMSYALSAMSQRVRLGKPSWEVHPPVNLYYDKLANLSDVFGKSNLFVKPFSSSSFLNNSFVEDFCSVIGFKFFSEFQNNESKDRNASLSDLSTRLGDAILYHLSGADGIAGVDFYNVFGECLEGLKGPGYQLSNLQKLVIQRVVSADNELLKKDYGIDLLNSDFDRVPKKVIQTLGVHPSTSVSDSVLDTLSRYFIQQKYPDFTFTQPVYKSTVEQVFSKVKGVIKFDSLGYDSDTRLLSLSFSIVNMSDIDWVGKILPFQAVVKISGDNCTREARLPFSEGGLQRHSSADFYFSIPVDLDNGSFKLTIAAVQDHVAWLNRSGLKDLEFKLFGKNGQLEIQ